MLLNKIKSFNQKIKKITNNNKNNYKNKKNLTFQMKITIIINNNDIKIELFSFKICMLYLKIILI